MKYVIVLVLGAVLIGVTGSMVISGSQPAHTQSGSPIFVKTTQTYPIAPGVWYPQNGAIPDKPVRYYRARCFPGCHKGSKHGLYPDELLNMRPIFPTSTFPAHLSTVKNAE